MKIKIRKAIASDVDGFVSIKDQLPLRYTDGRITRGGFLLGTDGKTYLHYILNDYCLIAEKDGHMIGFGIILKDSSVKRSDIWQRRFDAQWNIKIEDFEKKNICYFEQLAFVNGYSREVIKLAYNLVCWAFAAGHQHLFTTTVREPILNLAAVPYIIKASGSLVGHIHENYPLIGAIRSDIYKIDPDLMYRSVAQSALYPFLKTHYIAFE